MEIRLKGWAEASASHTLVLTHLGRTGSEQGTEGQCRSLCPPGHLPGLGQRSSGELGTGQADLPPRDQGDLPANEGLGGVHLSVGTVDLSSWE